MVERILIFAPDRGLAERVRGSLVSPDERLEVISPDEGALARALREGSESTAFVVSLEAPDPLAWISKLRRGRPRARVIAVGSAAPVELVLAALDAGADECFDVAGDLLPLMRALERGEAKPDSAGGRLICFLPAQCGSGASTAAAYVAAALAEEFGERVLLAELDFHAGALAFRLRLEPERTIAELSRYWHLSEQAWTRAISRWNGVDVLAAPPSVHQLRLRGLPPFNEILRVARERYDAVVADLPAGLTAATGALLRQAWRIYLCCTPELPALHLARRRVREVDAAGVGSESIRLVVGRWNSRSALAEEEISQVVGLPIAAKLPNDFAALRDADLEGRPLSPNRQLARALRNLGRDAGPPAPQRKRDLKTSLASALKL